MNVGESIIAKNASWTFGGKVPETFDDHVTKSVPLYEEGHDLITKISDFFLDNGSVCYEIGCSTAKLSKKILDHNKEKQITIIGLDNEAAMVKYAKSKYEGVDDLSIECANAADFQFKKSDLIISYYTLQFIKPKVRQLVVDNIYESLNWGGAFILFEKVRACDARFQDIMSALYMDYKLDNGYSSNEIVGKLRSLKGVLEPFSTNGNLDILKRAGFVDIMSIMKYVCFEGFLAIK